MLFLYDTSISSSFNCYSRNSSFRLINTLIMHKSAIIMHCLEKNHTHAFADTEYSVWYEMIEWHCFRTNTPFWGPGQWRTLPPSVDSISSCSKQSTNFMSSLPVCEPSQFLLIIGFSFSWFLHFMHACTKCTL